VLGLADERCGLRVFDAEILRHADDELLLLVVLIAIDERQEHRVLDEDAEIVTGEIFERDVVERALRRGVGPEPD
jgi:hypothetical protein